MLRPDVIVKMDKVQFFQGILIDSFKEEKSKVQQGIFTKLFYVANHGHFELLD